MREKEGKREYMHVCMLHIIFPGNHTHFPNKFKNAIIYTYGN